jgi:hypothetical protein
LVLLRRRPVVSKIIDIIFYSANQALIVASYEIKSADSVFIQADGTPDGSQPKVSTWFDPGDKSKTPDGLIHQFFAGIETTGKKAINIAEGVDHILTSSLGLNQPALKVFGLSDDSGGGTPESLFKVQRIAVIHPQNRFSAPAPTVYGEPPWEPELFAVSLCFIWFYSCVSTVSLVLVVASLENPPYVYNEV